MSGAVLLMAYGTPKSLDDVEAYYTHIRRGRPPTDEQLADLRSRYEAIGGSSPLLRITSAQAAGLSERLCIPVCVGLKHAEPFIEDAFRDIADADVDEVAGLVLAPHYSRMSIGEYEARARAAIEELGWSGTFTMVDSWHLKPGYIRLLAQHLEDAIAGIPSEFRDDMEVVFTAHSLPATILKEGDPYEEQLGETAGCIASEAGLSRWRVGWQSAGRTDAGWLGPNVIEIIDELATMGRKAVVVCPCGFVSDHLEILYDIDVEAAGKAASMGLAFARTASPNTEPAFLDTLASVARTALDRAA